LHVAAPCTPRAPQFCAFLRFKRMGAANMAFLSRRSGGTRLAPIPSRSGPSVNVHRSTAGRDERAENAHPDAWIAAGRCQPQLFEDLMLLTTPHRSGIRETPLRILLLSSSFNGLTQQVFVELSALGYNVSVELALSDEIIREAVRLFRPDLILCPFL